jgi:hypothetical protein
VIKVFFLLWYTPLGVYSKIAQNIGDSVGWPEGIIQPNTHSKRVLVYPIHMGKVNCGHFMCPKHIRIVNFFQNGHSFDSFIKMIVCQQVFLLL